MAASTTTILIAMALLSSHSSPLITSVHADAASTAEASHEPASISSFAQFPYDENNHLASHIFAFPGTDPCRSLFEEARKAVNLHSHIAMAVDGEVAAALFGDRLPTQSHDVSDITGCPAVCLDRVIDAELVPYPMPEKYYNINADHGEHDASLSSFLGSHSCGKVEIGIINYYPKPVNLYWVNFSGGEQLLNSIERMEKNTHWIHTYIDHRFRIVNIIVVQVCCTPHMLVRKNRNAFFFGLPISHVISDRDWPPKLSYRGISMRGSVVRSTDGVKMGSTQGEII
eukprot:scaffold89724_cov41-Cyclotella_meneghiniana.AAC.1